MSATSKHFFEYATDVLPDVIDTSSLMLTSTMTTVAKVTTTIEPPLDDRSSSANTSDGALSPTAIMVLSTAGPILALLLCVSLLCFLLVRRRHRAAAALTGRQPAESSERPDPREDEVDGAAPASEPTSPTKMMSSPESGNRVSPLVVSCLKGQPDSAFCTRCRLTGQPLLDPRYYSQEVQGDVHDEVHDQNKSTNPAQAEDEAPATSCYAVATATASAVVRVFHVESSVNVKRSLFTTVKATVNTSVVVNAMPGTESSTGGQSTPVQQGVVSIFTGDCLHLMPDQQRPSNGSGPARDSREQGQSDGLDAISKHRPKIASFSEESTRPTINSTDCASVSRNKDAGSAVGDAKDTAGVRPEPPHNRDSEADDSRKGLPEYGDLSKVLFPNLVPFSTLSSRSAYRPLNSSLAPVKEVATLVPMTRGPEIDSLKTSSRTSSLSTSRSTSRSTSPASPVMRDSRVGSYGGGPSSPSQIVTSERQRSGSDSITSRRPPNFKEKDASRSAPSSTSFQRQKPSPFRGKLVSANAPLEPTLQEKPAHSWQTFHDQEQLPDTYPDTWSRPATALRHFDDHKFAGTRQPRPLGLPHGPDLALRLSDKDLLPASDRFPIERATHPNDIGRLSEDDEGQITPVKERTTKPGFSSHRR